MNSGLPAIAYFQWRASSAGENALHDGAGGPSERLLQAIWWHQRLLRDKLATRDGRRVEVLHPGFWNHGAGPDFRDSVLRFDGGEAVTGDVEVDLQSSGWRAHRHDTNPNFNKVILHVVWEESPPATPVRSRSGRTEPPVLALAPRIDSDLESLSVWLGTESAREFPAELAGQCHAPLRELPAERVHELLRQAALVRLQAKAFQFQARARQAGWEQALWEGLFRALGYKQNVWPMQRLAELRPRLCPEAARTSELILQARLLGVAGLLPTELTRQQAGTDRYLRQVWDHWWRERELFRDAQLPGALWSFQGLRPANHPQRRLMLAAQWLNDGKLVPRLETWGLTPTADDPDALIDILQPANRDIGFWSRHWTLRSKPMPAPQPLLGASRATDIAINVLFPWLWMRAKDGGNKSLRQALEGRYFAWPAGEDNAVLRLARERLLGGKSRKVTTTAASQQGLLQIVRDFCARTNALCTECRFPEWVRSWK